MKFTVRNPKLMLREKRRRQKQWHKWFAWHPVEVISDDNKYKTWYWLTFIQRRIPPEWFWGTLDYEYKP